MHVGCKDVFGNVTITKIAKGCTTDICFQNGKKVWTPYIWLFWQLPDDIHWALTKWKWFDRVKDDERYQRALIRAEEMKKQG